MDCRELAKPTTQTKREKMKTQFEESWMKSASTGAYGYGYVTPPRGWDAARVCRNGDVTLVASTVQMYASRHVWSKTEFRFCNGEFSLWESGVRENADFRPLQKV